jgi:uncharacterized protein YbjT (DUF2867 family)
MKIVVIGGTGLIGSKIVAILRHGGFEVVAASPSSGVNGFTGEGLEEAVAGAQVAIDVTNSPSFEDTEVLEFFETSGRNLLAGPDPAPFNETIARYLKGVGDSREVVSDPEAPYFGSRIEERSLVSLGEARLGRIGFEEWLHRLQTGASSSIRQPKERAA